MVLPTNNGSLSSRDLEIGRGSYRDHSMDLVSKTHAFCEQHVVLIGQLCIIPDVTVSCVQMSNRQFPWLFCWIYLIIDNNSNLLISRQGHQDI